MPSIVIAQGGGPTAVINQTLCGAILAARGHDPSLRILGARYGVRGLTAGNVVDLTSIPEAQLRRLGNTPGSALGSSRWFHRLPAGRMTSTPMIVWAGCRGATVADDESKRSSSAGAPLATSSNS